MSERKTAKPPELLPPDVLVCELLNVASQLFGISGQQTAARRVYDAVETIRLMQQQRIELMRAYDPNEDEYLHNYELIKMHAASRMVDCLQRLAVGLGEDPEGNMSDLDDVALAKIDELENKITDHEATIAKLRRLVGEEG